MIPRFDAEKLVAAAEGSLAHQAACQVDARHHVLKSAVATLSGIDDPHAAKAAIAVRSRCQAVNRRTVRKHSRRASDT
jgi:hypothetical protein